MDTIEKLQKFSDINSCPIRNVISRFSGKWSLLILCILSASESPIRFNMLARTIPDISPKVLSETLKNLESDGLVMRTIYPEVPPRVEYSMTELGHSLMPHIQGLVHWAMDHFDMISCNCTKMPCKQQTSEIQQVNHASQF